MLLSPALISLSSCVQRWSAEAAVSSGAGVGPGRPGPVQMSLVSRDGRAAGASWALHTTARLPSWLATASFMRANQGPILVCCSISWKASQPSMLESTP